jgi:hypothetical protein
VDEHVTQDLGFAERIVPQAWEGFWLGALSELGGGYAWHHD